MSKITPIIFILFWSFIVQGSPTAIVLYTETPSEKGNEIEDLTQVTQFAFDQYDAENKTKTDIKLIGIDDKDNPENALASLKKISAKEKPIGIIGPLYSNVAMKLKDFVDENQIPLLSIFATHNDLTKNSHYVFRICASNRRLVKSMTDFLVPEIEKHHLAIHIFKDLADNYSLDLADTFRLNFSASKIEPDEILFRGIPGLERLQDLNSKIWTPSKSDILLLTTQDAVAGHILAAMESEPYLVAAIDPVNFVYITKKIKAEKTHIRLVTTSQWLPGKSDYSKKIEELFAKHFHRPMAITSALTYDAAYTFASAYHRAKAKGQSLVSALGDSTRLKGVTGLINIGRNGERVFSDQFLKEDFIE